MILDRVRVSGVKQECNFVVSMFCQFFILSIVSPGSVWSPLLDFQEAILKDISQLKNIGADMLFWQDGSFLGRATQIDPYTISGYMLSLLAMLLHWLMAFGKTMLAGSAERWGLCYASCPLLPIVSPGSMWSPFLGLQAPIFLNKKT